MRSHCLRVINQFDKNLYSRRKITVIYKFERHKTTEKLHHHQIWPSPWHKVLLAPRSKAIYRYSLYIRSGTLRNVAFIRSINNGKCLRTKYAITKPVSAYTGIAAYFN